MPIKIKTVIPNQFDGTSFYRAVGPLNALQRQGLIEWTPAQTLSWATLGRYDWLFLQRPYKKSDVQAIELAHKCKTRVWIDYDDDLTAVPPSNPCYSLYSGNETKETILECVRLADAVSVATPVLKELFRKVSQKLFLIPNAFNDSLLEAPPLQKRIQRVVWRGSATHNEDLQSVEKDIVKLMKDFPKVDWCFVGYSPWFITQQVAKNRVFYHAPVDPTVLLDLLAATAAQVAVVPLVKSDFNQAKSNCAWIEHTLAGSIVVAPDFGEWEGAIRYKQKPGSFYKSVAEALSMSSAKTEAIVKKNIDLVYTKYLLSKVNEVRYAMLRI